MNWFTTLIFDNIFPLMSFQITIFAHLYLQTLQSNVNITFCPKVLSQISQLVGFFLSWTQSLCFFIELLLLNFYLHIAQLIDFNLSWTNKLWLFILSSLEHLQSPLNNVTFEWFLFLMAWNNVPRLISILFSNFFPSWTELWMLILPFLSNEYCFIDFFLSWIALIYFSFLSRAGDTCSFKCIVSEKCWQKILTWTYILTFMNWCNVPFQL